MNNLTNKQKIIIAAVLVFLLVITYIMSDNPFRKKEIATDERLEEIKKDRSENMNIITGKEKIEDSGKKSSSESEKLTISSDITEIKRNSNHLFRVKIDGQSDFSEDLIWQIENQKSKDTWIDEDGLLSVGNDESSDSIKVKVRSDDNPTLCAEMDIKIQNPYRIKADTRPKTREELIKKAEASAISEAEKEEKIKAQEAYKEEVIKNTSKTDGKDKYLTDPTPEGRPKPVEPEETIIDKNIVKTATLSINCETILDNLDLFNQDKIDVLPPDGVVLSNREVQFYEGESVFDLLKRTVDDKKIHMEFVFTPIYNSVYIEGINNLYEFDCGPSSGWMYKVNGWFPNYGCSRYKLEEGDRVEWVYTCDLGMDVGNTDFGGEK